MPGTEERAPVYRFGVFELHAQSGELRKHGVRIKLQDQPRQILLLLLEHAGDVVTREQIQQHLWPDNTFVDFDNAINSAVRKLRDALGDTAENPRFIETLARRGYRFVAPVSSEPEKALKSEAPPPFVVKTRPKWPAVVLFVIAALAAAVLAGRLRRPHPPDLRFTPLTTYRGHQRQPSFSPEGTRVAFSWEGPDGRNTDIYVKLIGPSDPVRLTTDPARDFNPAWSPDGRWIAALRDMGRELAVILIPASGGGPQSQLASVEPEDPAGLTCRANGCYHGSTLAWSPEGNFLFTSSRTGRDSSLAIIRINVETGQKQPITAPRGAADLDPAVSPDGRGLAFLRTSGVANRDIWVVSLSDKALPETAPRQLTNDGAYTQPPVWTPNGRELIFSSDRRGRHELWRVPVSRPGTPVRLEGVGGDAFSVGISLRGQRLVYEQESNSVSLWKVSIGSNERAQPIRVTSTIKADILPHFSPDGKRIAFQSDRSGFNEIWICDANGSNAMQLTTFGKGKSGSPRWSPDGRTIVFDSNVEGNWEIWTIRPEGGRPLRLTRNPAEDFIPSWSHRGEWIYFASRRTGRYEIWKMGADGSSETQVTNGGGLVAHESSDGKYLYYRDVGTDTGGAPLWRIPVGGGPATKIMDSMRGRIFTPTQRGVFFPAGPDSTELRYFDFASGVATTVATLDNPGCANAVISPDGRFALCARSEHVGTNLILVENFR
jgi:Tol biopolymer transport system component/DNA-binding winged helix-turn-helix (wHTH) protein